MKNRDKFQTITHIGRRALAFAALFACLTTAAAGWLASAHAQTSPTTDLAIAAPVTLDTAPVPLAGQLMKNGKVLTGKLNINTATEDQLRMLPGIGPAKARRVLSYRSRHGKFKRVRDLRRVKGFGYKTVTKLAPHLSVKGQTTLKAE